ncbi:hypothetical protein Tco_0632270, partial [Tanacetum coccineum]
MFFPLWRKLIKTRLDLIKTRLDQDQAGSDPGETHESRPPPEHILIDKDQAGLDPGIRRVALDG